MAACVPLKPPSSGKGAVTFRVGFGYRYATKVIDLMAGSCDVAPWSPVRARRQGRHVGARRAGRAGRHLHACLPACPGSWSRPPEPTRRAGRDRRRPRRSGRRRRARPARRRRRGVTYVAIAAPRAGRWTLTPKPGSAPVTALRRGDGIPAPRVKARVSGRGHRRTLHWSLRAIRGQDGALRRGGPRERGRDRHDGQGARQQALRAGGRPGRPAVDRRGRRAGRDGARRIVAGRYAAPAPQRPAKPKRLTLRRAGGALQVRWKRAAGARDYRVRAELSDGRRLLLTVREDLAAAARLRPAGDGQGVGDRAARPVRRPRRRQADPPRAPLSARGLSAGRAPRAGARPSARPARRRRAGARRAARAPRRARRRP